MASKYEALSDKDLAKLAKKYNVEITDAMDRKAVEEAVELAELEAEEAAKAKADKAANKSGKVQIEFLDKGTITDNGKKWIGKMTDIVTEDEANDLMMRFPSRFRILGDE